MKLSTSYYNSIVTVSCSFKQTPYNISVLHTNTQLHMQTHTHTHTHTLSLSLSLTHTHTQPLTPQLNRAATKRDSKWQRQHHAKIIANKLKIFGDEISSTHEEELQREFVHIITTHTNPRQVIEFFSLKLRHMLLGLSWQNIGKVFHLSYHLIEFLNELLGSSADMTGTREWAEFSELWDLTIGSVTRWISSNGGWVRNVV